jgi:hypothetical protein
MIESPNHKNVPAGVAGSAGSTGAVISWSQARQPMIYAILFVAGAVALGVYHHPVAAGIVGFLGAIVLVGGLTKRRGPCPVCGSTLEVAPGPNWCARCHDYMFFAVKRITRMKPNWVCDSPDLLLPVGLLKGPSEWQWPLPGRCAVCTDEAKRTETLAFTASLIQYRFEVPHCRRHSRGVEYEKGVLKFRSYSYWRAFRDQNAGTYEWGDELGRVVIQGIVRQIDSRR